MNHHRLIDLRVQSRFLEYNLLIVGFTVEYTKIIKGMLMLVDVLDA